MRIYSAPSEETLLARQFLKDWAGDGFITKAQYEHLEQDSVSELRTTNIFLRLVLFFFSLIFLLLPGMVQSVTADLRPRELFICAWSLMALAVYFRRPFLEKLLFFIFLLCIREEGILLGAVLVVFDFIRTRQWKQTLVYLALMLFFSTLVRSQAAAIGMGFATLLLFTLLGSLPGIADYLPARLMVWSASLFTPQPMPAWAALWTSLAIIDFGDARIGDIYTELNALHLDLFARDKRLLSAFLDAYGMDPWLAEDFARKIPLSS